MVRIGISVEGLTEERFVKNTLAPYLEPKAIYIQPISLNGKVNIDRITHELEKLVYNFDYITTFYDFYGFQRKSADETKESLEAKIMSKLKKEIRNKVIPYIQVYEFEGLLFSSPEAIASILQDEKLIEWANNVLKKYAYNPEKINDSPETAPSKRLEKNTFYRKTTHGPNIAKEIGIEKLRQMCTGFNNWLTQIERLAS